MNPLTFNGNSGTPLWTLDGQRIVFLTYKEDKADVYWRAADNTGNDEFLVSSPEQLIEPCAWSSDGQMLITSDFRTGRSSNIGSLSMKSDHAYKQLLQNEIVEMQPAISPNGKWMAYTANNVTGDLAVFVCPFPDIDKGRWQVSMSDGHSPLWSPDGKELFYRNDEEVIAVPVETEPTFKRGKPEILFRNNYISLLTTDRHTWDIHPDGKRFLMMKLAESSSDVPAPPTPRKINIVLNWFEELKEWVPTD